MRRAWLVAAAALAAAGCARRPADPLEALLADLRRQAPALRRFRVAFEEEKRLVDPDATVRVSGAIWGRVDAEGAWLRIEADAPHASTAIVTPREVLIYTPRERQFERAPLPRAPAFASLLPALLGLYGATRASLEEAFAARLETDGPAGEARLYLSPRGAPARAWDDVSGPVEVAWEGSRRRLARIAWTAADGARYVWRLGDMTFLREVSPERFRLDPPAGTQRVELPDAE